MGWNETIQVMTDLFEEEWGGREVVEVEDCLEFTLSVGTHRLLLFLLVSH